MAPLKRTGLLIVGLALISAALVVNAKPLEKSDSKVKATATATKIAADGSQTVTINLDVDKGWHIYANPVGWEKLADNRTAVTFKGKDNVAATVTYPVGKLKMEKDGKAEVEYRIYEGRVILQAQVKRTPGDTSPLQIDIEVNACNKNTCLFPGTVKLTVP